MIKLHNINKSKRKFIDDIEYDSEGDVVMKSPPQKYRKKYISSTLKRLVWNTYISEYIGKHECFCCKLTEITQLSFHCGHVIAERNGGETTIENLRPICQNCNSSMRTQNMFDFMNKLK